MSTHLAPKTALLIGTADTKADELNFLRQVLHEQGVAVLLMDVGVLSQGDCAVDIGNDVVARAGNSNLQAVIDCGDENTAMQVMALGAARLAAELYAQEKIDGMLALGGTMGTDLALDVALALPMGVPKVVLSTVAHSHLIAPQRISPDLMMVLWAGGLYGLNSLCQSALSQAAGALAGAMRAAQGPRFDRPLIGMTSLGKSCLRYMVTLKPALEARGFEVAVFHTTGMGGRAFEALAAQGRFAAVLDLSLQELANHVGDSCVTSGENRLLGAGFAGVPQIVAPGAADMVDFPAWQPVPDALAGRNVHVHNRLIASATSPIALREKVAHEIVHRLAQAKAHTALILPLKGVEAWDLPGEPLHDPEGLSAFINAVQAAAAHVKNPLFTLHQLDAHINDASFCDAVLGVFDDWLARGIVKRKP
jgi:uncharacterized protein (UPF0261 family)